MCESHAFLQKANGSEELLLEDVVEIEDNGGELKFVSIIGEVKTLKGKISSISLLDHKILVSDSGSG